MGRLSKSLYNCLVVLSVSLVLFGLYSPIVKAEPLSEDEQIALDNYPNWVAASCGTTGLDKGNSGSTVDIDSIAKKYDLQSAMIQELGGPKVADYHADDSPTTPASTMKLIIADTLLRSSVDLGKTVSVGRDVYYDGGNDLGKSSITIKDALKATLSASSNVGANVLMKALGGVSAFTDKAHHYGYTHTDVKGYYDPSNDGKNNSTISDEVKAMDHIFSADGSDYKIAQDALETAAKNDNHYNVDDDANKWAGTDKVAGNVGKFKVGNKDYIIGLYINKPSSDPDAIKAVKEGSADLAKAAEGASSGKASAPDSSACCNNDAGDNVGNSDGSDKGSWSSGLKPPYILEQWATETLKDLAQKKKASETDAVTKQHVIALVAFAIGEGGDIANGDLFNPLNTGIDAPELVQGGHSVSGVQSFKSFDAGVEAAARTLARPQYSRMATALLKPNTTAKQFMYALSYNWKLGGSIWAEASRNEPSYYNQRLALVKQVSGNYKNTASIIIGTSAKEQLENKRDPSKLHFTSGGSPGEDGEDCGSSTSGDATAISTLAIKLSWPDSSHGTTPKPEYKKAYEESNPHGPGMADCGGFVATVMHASGADKDYPPGGTGAQEAYVREHPDKYDVVDKVSSVKDLKPGDILIVNKGGGSGVNGHTYIFVGNQKPHNYDEASASLGSRAANLGKAVLSDGRGNYIRARLK